MKTEPIGLLQDDLPRAAGVPVAHLMGCQRFMGLDLQTSADALIPRKETELLGITSLTILRRLVAERGSARVLDLCTGSGNLAVAMACYEPACSVVATDISAQAVELARRNARYYQISSRVQFFAGDLFAALPDALAADGFDLIICNPPYIPSGRLEKSELILHEPRAAFDGGPFGLSIITRLIQESPAYLKPDSSMCVEVGRGQGEFVVSMLERAPNFVETAKYVDAARDIRVVAARTVGQPSVGLKP